MRTAPRWSAPREHVGPHGQAAPLLEPVDASLDGIALLVRLSLEARWTASGATPLEAVSDLFGGLRDDRSNPASAQMPTVGAGGDARSARTTSGRVLGRPGPVRGTRILAMTAAKAAASPAWPAVTCRARGRAWLSLARWTFVLKPPRKRPSAWSPGLGPARRPLFLAPAACWWARQTVESTATVQPTSSTTSAPTRRAAKIRSQVPSTAHLIKRLCAVLNEPSSLGRSLHPEQVRYFHAMASRVLR